ncbi:MAG TPA: cation-translocating P-type ATPase [Burkholderiaceae bacterium]|nr:cation-translocating P-type ATPase [Burkholderiaceae bacterium]
MGPLCQAIDASTLEAGTVAQALHTDLARGLAAPEAARRLEACGRNELSTPPPPAAWHRLVAQFHDPLVYLLLAALAIALLAWGIEGFVGWPLDAMVIAAIVALNGVLGHWQEARAQDAVATLARLTEATSIVVRDGRPQRVPAAELVCGDLLVLGEGDAVGADARLVQADALRVQEAALTGESEAVLKDAATLAAPAALGDRLDMVFKGTHVAQGGARAVVTATGMQTQIGRIAHLLAGTAEAPTPLQKEMARVGRVMSLAVGAIAALVVGSLLLLSNVRGTDGLIEVLLLGVSLAVAAVPEGLPAILSVVLALGVQRMAQRRAIVKNLSSVETLGSASVIAADKTGTLTRAEMTLVRVMTASGSSQVTGVGYAPHGRVEHQGSELPAGALRDEHVAVLGGGSLAGNADLRQAADGTWQVQGDPTEAAFLVAERKLGTTARREQRFERIRDIPFTSERKMMSTIALDHEHGGAPVLFSKGAPDLLLQRCTQVRVGLQTLPLDAALRARLLADVATLTDAALRTLAVAYRPLAPDEALAAARGDGQALEHGLVFVGTVGLTDPPREEARTAILQARRAGIRVLMITGDHPRTAARIAADLELAQPGAAVLTGLELDALDDAAFAAAVRRTSVYARVTPAHKLRIVAALQADGQVVAMTGDGVNDAPALKAADIGVAMGITGTEVTRQAARMILADDNFATLVEAVREGRGIFDNIRKFLRYLLSSNMGEVLTVFLGVLGAGVIGLGTDTGGAVVLPLLATQILWINLITDSAPALAMGVDPATDDMMGRPPRRPAERVIDAAMIRGVLLVGAAMAALTLLTLDLYLPGGLIDGTRELANARTAGFTVLVLAQLFNCFNARSETASAFSHLFVNPWLWGSVALGVALQVAVVHLPVLNLAFGTVPLDAGQWAVCVAMASGVLWVSEARKWLGRLLAPAGSHGRGQVGEL